MTSTSEKFLKSKDTVDLCNVIFVSASFSFSVYDCVCECLVCLYPSTVKASPVCNDVLDILECMDQRSCVVGIILDPSAKFFHLSF